MIPDCTLVTACFDLTKYNKKCRNFDELILIMKSLLDVPCYLVIYGNNSIINMIKNIRDVNGFDKLTKYIVCEPEELDSFKLVDIVRSNREKYHPTKDERTCPESHLVCCSKFELVLKTIELNPFNTSKFGWIDSNVGVNFSKICTHYKNNMLLKVLNECSKDKFHLQILNVNDKKYTNEANLREYYSSYKWVVCGCLFITGKNIGKEILSELNSIFIKHTMLGYGHGEEMFYLEILDTYYDKLERSYGDYNHILNNFNNINVGFDYINYIANRYMSMGFYKECIDCCSKVISQYEIFNTEINYNLYFNFLFYKYISLFYYDNNQAKQFVRHIMNLIQDNELIKLEYYKNKQFYDQQFQHSL
jgi:tetratricopeptide (TPR) repeat protein